LREQRKSIPICFHQFIINRFSLMN